MIPLLSIYSTAGIGLCSPCQIILVMPQFHKGNLFIYYKFCLSKGEVETMGEKQLALDGVTVKVGFDPVC